MSGGDFEDRLKVFALTNQLIEHDLDRVELELAIELRPAASTAGGDEDYYPQIDSSIRSEAASMAPHYEVFYSLETSIRRLVTEQLQATDADWWEARVREHIRAEAAKRRSKEIDSGVTPRSDDLVDFLTFGELTEVIKENWDVFGAMFSSVKAVERVMGNLNTLRGPIAHCSPLAEDEVLRLKLAVRDWFRLSD